MINTGTVIGVSSNVFGSGFPNKFVPSFSWGAIASTQTYILEKAIEDAKKMSSLKKQVFDEQDEVILNTVFNDSDKFRK